ncbi:hypothetical protein TPE_0242 [Treponema pedis str. T A4]|uniref:Uncharacterized protein n=1 Tax=Treponema pedis str. T A4 TaxID=1291379 RepID=S5ZXN5_9SPIR|nr:hypothetical protein TPE_0242 [Treponema pedis str. T A4]
MNKCDFFQFICSVILNSSKGICAAFIIFSPAIYNYIAFIG